MLRIPTTYEYKIYRDGVYLGLLPNVTSDFKISQSINTAGSQLMIDIGDTTDTSHKPVRVLTDESGNPLTTEDNQPLTTEREEDLVGDSSDKILIRNDNTVLVYEVSQNYPRGKKVFDGYISEFDPNFGGNESIRITVLNNSQDTQQSIIPGGESFEADPTQTSTNSDFGFWKLRPYGQTFKTDAGCDNIAKIALRVARGSAANRNMTVKLWASRADAIAAGTPLASASVLVTSTSKVETDFVFDAPVDVSELTSYAFTLETPDAASVSGDSTTWGAFDSQSPANYSDGQMFRVSDNTDTTESMWFKIYEREDTTERYYVGRDPSYMLNDIMEPENYSGAVTPSRVFPDTGLTIPEYSFKLATVLEGIKAIGNIAPPTWYWYIDPADNVLYFEEASTTADIKLIKGKHLGSVNIKATKEGIVDTVYFTGGDDGTGDNVFVVVSDPNPANLRRGIARLTDSNVKGANGEATARVLAQNYIDGHNSQTYETSVRVLASTMDVTLFKLGMMIGFAGFGTYVDKLLLQIVGIDRDPDGVTLKLGTLEYRPSQQVEQLQQSISNVQVKDNPNVPS